MAEQEWIVVKVGGVMVGQIQRVVRWDNQTGAWCLVDGSHYRIRGGAVLFCIDMPNKPKGMMYDLDDELQELQEGALRDSASDYAETILSLIEQEQRTTPKRPKKTSPTAIVKLIREECESELQR